MGPSSAAAVHSESMEGLSVETVARDGKDTISTVNFELVLRYSSTASQQPVTVSKRHLYHLYFFRFTKDSTLSQNTQMAYFKFIQLKRSFRVQKFQLQSRSSSSQY
jgi:hypothetical protein